MKNKNGFTLIELLATIVILAIIALIVTPVVSNIVANARIAANARSVEGHIRNIELAIITKAFGEESTGDLDSFDTITSGATIEGSLSRPGNDNVTCTSYTIKHGTVLSAQGCGDTEEKWGKKYKYTNTNGAYVFEFNGTFVAAGSGETHKGVVYMDPTNPKTVCNTDSDVDVQTRREPTGCMKFYIYDDNEEMYKMILDRNFYTSKHWAWISKEDYVAKAISEGLTEDEANANWNANKYNIYGPITLNNTLATTFANWSNTGSVRLISADEIAHIVGADSNDTIKWSSSLPYGTTVGTQSSWFYLDGGRNSAPTTYSSSNGWQKLYANSTTKSNYAWLFDYTRDCRYYGCNNNIQGYGSKGGYWTSNLVNGTTSDIWRINYEGKLSNYGYYNFISSGMVVSPGIRPVLEIPKSLIG